PYTTLFRSPTELPDLTYLIKSNDPYGTRTRVTAVKGRCLNRLTNGPYKMAEKEGFEPSHREYRSTPLAGAPLQPLEYFSNWLHRQDSNLLLIALQLIALRLSLCGILYSIDYYLRSFGAYCARRDA